MPSASVSTISPWLLMPALLVASRLAYWPSLSAHSSTGSLTVLLACLLQIFHFTCTPSSCRIAVRSTERFLESSGPHRERIGSRLQPSASAAGGRPRRLPGHPRRVSFSSG